MSRGVSRGRLAIAPEVALYRIGWVETPAGCWEWSGCRNSRGYGVFGHRGRQYKAHRVAWQHANQQTISPGLVVRHKCDNPPCVNPDHLETGTDADNHRDREERGRTARGEQVASTNLKAIDVMKIKAILSTELLTQGEIAVAFGVTQATISRIALGKSWAHVDFPACPSCEWKGGGGE